MTELYLHETDLGPEWYPIADARPLAEQRAGAWLIRERWQAIAGTDAQAIFAPEHLRGFSEDGVPPVVQPHEVTGPAIVGLPVFVPSGVALELPKSPATLTNDDHPVGWWIPAGERWSPADPPSWDPLEVDGLRMHGSYDLVTALEYLLAPDTADFTHEGGDQLPDGSIVIGDPSDVVVLGAAVEPGVIFDVRRGAVVIEQHAHVRSGTRFEGPVIVGPGTEVHGGTIAQSAFGPRCKIRGDIVSTVFAGYANKVHEGFIGHSVVGRWVNLGAGTTTSNLKNTYGAVRVNIGGERVETGRQLLGTVFADHSKTAIGTYLDTGTLIGTGANVFGWARPPKHVAPFAWGADGKMRRDGFLDIASRVMPRRKVEFTDAVRESLGRIYDHVMA
jgi:UDP-N-acetylglucosamine diphosphorylase/glucosamine-1-phosphate N-acetyltransferase